MLHLIIKLRPYAKYFLIAGIISILTISSLPSLVTPKIDTGKIEIRLDYVFHLMAYGSLAFFTYLTFAPRNYKIPFKKYFILTISLMVFSVLDEYHQKLIPGRTFNPNDILSNLLGIIGGLIVCVVLFRAIIKRNLY